MHGSAPHALVLCHVAGATEIEGYPGPSAPAARRARRAARARVAAAAPGTGRGDRAQHAGAERRRCARCRPLGAPRKPAFRPTTRCGSAPAWSSTPSWRSCNPEGRGPGEAELDTAVRLTLACAWRARLRSGRGRRPRGRRRRRPAEDSPENAEHFYDAMNDVGLTENRITVLWDSRAADDDPGPRRDRARRRARGGARHPRHALRPPGPGARDHRLAAGHQRVRRLPRPRRAHVPAGQGLHRRQRAEQGPLLAAAVQRERHRPQPAPPTSRSSPRRTTRSRRSTRASRSSASDSARGEPTTRSPRGNLSISPLRCIRDMGRAYRASKRRRPIMDEISFHPHPNAATDHSRPGYSWPNAGVPNLARIKQAVWDAFYGTAQPTFEEAGLPRGPVRTLKMRLNEVGWQVAIPPASRAAYYGKRERRHDRRGHSGGDLRQPDPAARVRPGGEVAALLQPGRRCRTSTAGSPGSARGLDSAALLRDRQGRDRRWPDPLCRPAGRLAARVPARGLPPAPSSEARGPRSERNTAWSFVAGSEEATRYSAGIFRVRRPGKVSPAVRGRIVRSLRSARGAGAVLRSNGKLGGGWDRVIPFRAKRLKPGFYVCGAWIVADLNPHRKATYVGRAFSVRSRGVSGGLRRRP